MNKPQPPPRNPQPSATAKPLSESDPNWKHVGKIKDPHGLKGDLEVLIFSREASWATKLKQCRIGGELHQVERAKAHKEGLLLKVQNISDRNASEAAKGQNFEVPSELFVSAKGETIYLAEILGFEVWDRDLTLGKIEKFSSNGPQDLLVILWQGREVEIPFVEAFIAKIDFENRRIHMDLPEGLMDLVPEPKAKRPGP